MWLETVSKGDNPSVTLRLPSKQQMFLLVLSLRGAACSELPNGRAVFLCAGLHDNLAEHRRRVHEHRVARRR